MQVLKNYTKLTLSHFVEYRFSLLSQVVKYQTHHLRRIQTQRFTSHWASKKASAFQRCQSQTNPKQKDSAAGLKGSSISIRIFVSR